MGILIFNFVIMWFIQLTLILFTLWLFFYSVNKGIEENAKWFIVTLLIVIGVFYAIVKGASNFAEANFGDKNTIMENGVYLNY